MTAPTQRAELAAIIRSFATENGSFTSYLDYADDIIARGWGKMPVMKWHGDELYMGKVAVAQIRQHSRSKLWWGVIHKYISMDDDMECGTADEARRAVESAARQALGMENTNE